ncbi:unnamed protein product [Cercospora beticola]|nr:unnamed protein product [Cercospora beticola]
MLTTSLSAISRGCDIASRSITTTTTPTTTTTTSSTTSTTSTTSGPPRAVCTGYRFVNTLLNPRQGQFLGTNSEFDRVTVRDILPEQAQRFTISPSGRLIAILPDRAVDGLIIYAFDSTSPDALDVGQIDFRAAGNSGVPVDARNVQLTCTVNSGR